MKTLIALLAIAAVLPAATKVIVTVIEQKSGAPVAGLEAKDFAVFDDKTPRKVEDVEFTHDTLDLMLLLDTSIAGGAVQPVVENFVGELQRKEQMAVVAFHSSADLIQDFTSSRELILRAISQVKYGNSPHVLDALYAAIDGGFQPNGFRRAILLLITGVEGDSRVSEREVIRLARRNGISIYPVYMGGFERSMFESLAKQTGGASFNLRDMKKASDATPAKRVFEVLRGHYVLSVSGNLGFGEKLRVDVKRPEKLQVSAMAVD